MVGSVLRLIGEGGGSTITVYIKESSKEKFLTNSFRKFKEGDPFPNALKPFELALRGASNIYVYEKSDRICENKYDIETRVETRCPQTFTIPADDIQSIRYE